MIKVKVKGRKQIHSYSTVIDAEVCLKAAVHGAEFTSICHIIVFMHKVSNKSDMVCFLC